MAFVAESRMLANVWLRPGNAHTANNAIGFLQSTKEHLGHKRIGLLRADSGFCEQGFLCHLEQSCVPYTVALRLVRPLQHQLVSAQWWPLADCDPQIKGAIDAKDAKEFDETRGIELCELSYQAASWDAPRRVIGVRQHIKTRPQTKGKTLSLFADDADLMGWRYRAIVTDLALPALQVWRLYRGRADYENRIKELKYDFALGTLVRRSFWATEAALHWVMLSYNLMALFKAVMQRQVNQSGSMQMMATAAPPTVCASWLHHA